MNYDSVHMPILGHGLYPKKAMYLRSLLH